MKEKIKFGDAVEFILDGNPAHKGKGKVVEVWGHSYGVVLTEPVKEFSEGTVIIVSLNEMVNGK